MRAAAASAGGDDPYKVNVLQSHKDWMCHLCKAIQGPSERME